MNSRPECSYKECPVPDRCNHYAACQYKGGLMTLPDKLVALRESFDLGYRGKRGGKRPNKSVTDALVRVAIEAVSWRQVMAHWNEFSDSVKEMEGIKFDNALAALEAALEEKP